MTMTKPDKDRLEWCKTNATNKKLEQWEREFLKDCSKRDFFTQGQRATIDRIKNRK